MLVVTFYYLITSTDTKWPARSGNGSLKERKCGRLVPRLMRPCDERPFQLDQSEHASYLLSFLLIAILIADLLSFSLSCIALDCQESGHDVSNAE